MIETIDTPIGYISISMSLILKQHELFTLLLSLLSKKSCIVEVGAYTGNHTKKFIEYLAPREIHCFEPMPEIYQILEKNMAQFPLVHCYPYAVSNKNGTAPLHIAYDPKKEKKISSANSLLKPYNRLNFSSIRYQKEIIVNTITLDKWFLNHQHSVPVDLLWIDAQGHEYEILEGATHLLSYTTLIHTEVHFNNAYENQKDYIEIIQFLKSYNFVEIARDFDNIEKWFFGNLLFCKNI